MVIGIAFAAATLGLLVFMVVYTKKRPIKPRRSGVWAAGSGPFIAGGDGGCSDGGGGGCGGCGCGGGCGGGGGN